MCVCVCLWTRERRQCVTQSIEHARTHARRDNGGGVYANRPHGTNDDTNDGVFVFHSVVCALTHTRMLSDGEETRFRAIRRRARRRWRKGSR